MKIAINPEHKNKMPEGLFGSELRAWWNKFNGGFRNVELPSGQEGIDALIAAIHDGYAYTTQHTGYRKADNFRCGQHIGLDFDTGDDRSSFEGILRDKFIQDHASFLHTTASHTDDSPRARAIFVLDRPIYSVGKYSLLTEAFAETYKTNGSADPSCKDPVRLFFGAEGCGVRQLGNILTLEKAAEIVLPYKESMRKRRQSMPQTHVTSLLDRDFLIDRMVDKIQGARDGEKWFILGKVAREAGGYVGAGYFERDYMFNVLFQAISSRSSTKDLQIAEDRIEWGLSAGQLEPLYLKDELDPFFQRMLA